MNVASDALSARLETTLGSKVAELVTHVGELTLVVKVADWIDVAHCLRDVLGFEQMVDLCGVDYQDFGDGAWEGNRFAVVLHLLSISHNLRLRVRTFAEDDDFPIVPSVVEVWPSANWYEREAFDLYGILFDGHPDLRRILTDYGFVGHPFRKDFPLSGNVEMRYDPEQGRVVYQPVTIDERVLVPRVIREETYRG
ncbi:MAG: NADH-quinone oxidoreductase subunit C [Proteobacteria bacterium]|nr:NADH-quinone oxidoreductase subunit C [Pseudomonadota bacterium]MDE3208819.1 NADH-quinone oxidoreductase subunit C [Pseudomonadota bacterium]